MKNVLLLFFGLLFPFSILTQVQYSAGMGVMINAPKNELGEVSSAPFSYYATLGVHKINNLGKFGADFEWNTTNWSTTDLTGGREILIQGSFFQTSNLTVTPNLEFKFLKHFGFNAGFYLGIKLSEEAKESNFSRALLIDEESNITQRMNFGYRFGGKIHFSKMISLKFNFIKGFMNVARSGVREKNGNSWQSAILKNRIFQLGLEFNLSEY